MKLKLLFTLLAFLTLNNIIGSATESWRVVGLKAIRNLDGSYQVTLTVRNPATNKTDGYVKGIVKKTDDNLYFIFITKGGYEVKQVIDGKTELSLTIGSFDCLVTTKANNALARLGQTPPLTKWGIPPADNSCVVS